MGAAKIEPVIERWHEFVRGRGSLDDLLDDDVVFFSPIVYTPQEGKAITTMYLQAAGQTLPGDGGDGAFRYTKEVLAGNTAVLEHFTAVGTRLFFTVTVSPSATDLWVSDGTSGGTVPLKRFTSQGLALASTGARSGIRVTFL